MNCPRCGKKVISQLSQREIILDLIKFIAQGVEPNYCNCSPDAPIPEFWRANEITEEQAKEKGHLAWLAWRTHHLPQMKDCRDLDYSYAIVDGRVICKAEGSYYDITDEVVALENF